MNYPVHLKGYEDQLIEVQTAGAFAGPKLLVNGSPAPKGAKRGEMFLRRKDGTETVARWKPQMLGFDVPQLQVDEETVAFVEPLKWYEWVWSGLPLVLIFAGGALGAVAGVLALGLNIKLFRSEMSPVVKYMVTLGVSAVAFVIFMVVALLINSALG